MKITVIGATGGTGRLVVDQALARRRVRGEHQAEQERQLAG